MKLLKPYILLMLLTGTVLTSCADDSPSSDGVAKGKEQVSTAISNTPERWTYYSLEENKIVGYSEFNDSTANAAWAARNDWDIAVSGDLVRTNSGDSGVGMGGILESEEDYATLRTAPLDGYSTDVYE